MNRLLLLVVLIGGISQTDSLHAERAAIFEARRGPWIVYRYPLFREGNRPPAARRHSQTSYWPMNVYDQYPKFYGGFHSRFFDEIGRPSGDLGMRGTAW